MRLRRMDLSIHTLLTYPSREISNSVRYYTLMRGRARKHINTSYFTPEPRTNLGLKTIYNVEYNNQSLLGND